MSNYSNYPIISYFAQLNIIIIISFNSSTQHTKISASCKNYIPIFGNWVSEYLNSSPENHSEEIVTITGLLVAPIGELANFSRGSFLTLSCESPIALYSYLLYGILSCIPKSLLYLLFSIVKFVYGSLMICLIQLYSLWI